MTEGRDDIERKLSDLSARTDGIKPRADFSLRVMQSVGRESSVETFDLRVAARRFFPVGVVVVALAALWAFTAEREANEAWAVSDSSAELAW